MNSIMLGPFACPCLVRSVNQAAIFKVIWDKGNRTGALDLVVGGDMPSTRGLAKYVIMVVTDIKKTRM